MTVSCRAVYLLCLWRQDGLHCGYRYLRKMEGDDTAMGYEGQLPTYNPEQFIPVPVSKGSFFLVPSSKLLMSRHVHQ